MVYNRKKTDQQRSEVMRIRIEPITEQNQKDVWRLETACGQEGFVESVEVPGRSRAVAPVAPSGSIRRGSGRGLCHVWIPGGQTVVRPAAHRSKVPGQRLRTRRRWRCCLSGSTGVSRKKQIYLSVVEGKRPGGKAVQGFRLCV